MVYAEAKFQIRPAGHRLCTSPILCYGRRENFNVGKRYILPSGAMSTQGAQRSYDAEANPPGGQSIGNHQQHAPPSHAAAAQGGQQANVLGQRERADALSAEVQSLDRNEPIDHLLANLQGDNRPRKRQQPAYGQEYEPDNGQSTQ